MFATALNEIAHIFAFSINLFPRFVDSKYKTIPKEKTVILNKNGRQMIITSRVVAAARKHFNCDKIEGLEIENKVAMELQILIGRSI